jgi:predicted dehydrogenase
VNPGTLKPGTLKPGSGTRTIVVGAGNMGRKWLRTVAAHPATTPVGLVDLDVELARRVADAETGDGFLAVGASLDELARETSADVVIDATVPAAHRSVTTTALRLGLAVLGEKPAAPTLAEAIALAALAEATGGVFVVSQSRRFNRQLVAVRRFLDEGGRVGELSARFFRGPRFGGFRDEMASPLVVDMAIHLFDIARWLSGGTPVAVYARETNPPWSWYRGAASARAIVEFDGGIDFAFDGSWAGLGLDTSWNGDWRLTTDRGTVAWNGDDPAVVQAGREDPVLTIEPAADAGESLAGSLGAFVASLDAGTVADNEIHDNLRSLSIVEAVLASSASGERVLVDDILEAARAEARARAVEWGIPEIEPVLEGWPSVAVALDAVMPGAPRAR